MVWAGRRARSWLLRGTSLARFLRPPPPHQFPQRRCGKGRYFTAGRVDHCRESSCDSSLVGYYPIAWNFFHLKNRPRHTMNSQPTHRRIWPAVIWVLVFAILMGVRPEFSSMWVRAVVAGSAGGALGWGIWAASSRRS